MSDDLPRVSVSPQFILETCTELLVREGVREEIAAAVSRHLVEADRMGIHSHGCMRIAQYVKDVREGAINPDAVPMQVSEMGSLSVMDGGFGFGQVGSEAAVDKAVAMASTSGIGLVSVRRLGHTGRIGSYSERIARAGMFGLAMCSSDKSGHYVAPFGGIKGRLGTNPIAFAFPRAGGLICADFSTSAMPEGAIRNLFIGGKAAPPEVLRDFEGKPTTDPSLLYADPPGAIQPFGGSQGYKSTALSILVEVLTTLLAGLKCSDSERRGSTLTILAIAADSGLANRGEDLASYLLAAGARADASGFFLPGQVEQQRLASNSDEVSIPLDIYQVLLRENAGSLPHSPRQV